MMKIVIGISAVTLAVVLMLFDPASSSFFLTCPFKNLTHLDCPGCGSQRAIYALLNGDILKAADYNLMLVAGMPFMIAHKKIRAYHIAPWITGMIICCFWILRNIPAAPFSWLAS